MRFAKNPRKDAFKPLTQRVRLGLGPRLVTTRTREQLRTGRGWVIGRDDALFRAYVGPFSAPEIVRRHLMASAAAGTRGHEAYRVRVGPHRHCASPPMPAPRRVRHLRRVALLPSPESIDSCLSWFSVDFFVDDKGEVQAITLDFWEP